MARLFWKRNTHPGWTLRPSHPMEPAPGAFTHPSELLVSLAKKTGTFPSLFCDDTENCAKVMRAIEECAKEAKLDDAALQEYRKEAQRLFRKTDILDSRRRGGQA